MSALQNNIDALREQLAKEEAILEQLYGIEDEKIWREAKEKEDTSWVHNIAILKKLFEPKQKQGEKKIAKFKKNEQDAAIYHLFKRLDERLSHIEQFGMMVYEEEDDTFLEKKPQSPHLSHNYKMTKLTGHNPAPVFATSTLLDYSNANNGLSIETHKAMMD